MDSQSEVSPSSGSERVLRSRVRLEQQETSGSIAVAEASVLLIYLDLGQPIAIVRSEPAAAEAVDADVELKRRLDCFLGRCPARRTLYNPSGTFEDIPESEHVPEESVRPEPAKWERLQLPRMEALKSFPLLRQKLFVENVQRLNAASFEQQTPRQLKEPIDLTHLPDEKQRTHNCREHKALVQQIQEQELDYKALVQRIQEQESCTAELLEQEQHLLCYDFLSSLSPDTPLVMCHPLALGYRQQSFDDCKAELAKSLFGLVNHVVFYCGLRQCIDWLPPRKLHGSCALSLGSDLQRQARVQLPSHIRKAGELIELLLHEMCHAAAFVYNGEMAHGLNTRKWAYRAKSLLPQLPLVADCAASCRYTCRLCRRSACGDIRFRGKQQLLLRCFHCQFELIVDECSGDSAHEPRPAAQSDTSYMIYIRARYAQCDQSGHSSKMRALNAQYSRTQMGSKNT